MTVRPPSPPALGSLIRLTRKERGWSRVDLVRAAGYGNMNRGLRRLDGIETGETPFPKRELLARFAVPLDLTFDRLEAAMRADFEAMDRVPMRSLVVRLVAAVYRSIPFPEGLSDLELQDFAADRAREIDQEVCLSLSPVRRVYIHPNGHRSTSLGPGMHSVSLWHVLVGGSSHD